MDPSSNLWAGGELGDPLCAMHEEPADLDLAEDREPVDDGHSLYLGRQTSRFQRSRKFAVRRTRRIWSETNRSLDDGAPVDHGMCLADRLGNGRAGRGQSGFRDAAARDGIRVPLLVAAHRRMR